MPVTVQRTLYTSVHNSDQTGGKTGENAPRQMAVFMYRILQVGALCTYVQIFELDKYSEHCQDELSAQNTVKETLFGFPGTEALFG